MSKLVKILDRKPMEIYVGRKTRGPILGIRLDESVIGRLLRSTDAPRDIYAMNPAGKSVRLTLDNYKLSEEELFTETKEVKKENSLANAVQNALNKSAEDAAKFTTESEVKSDEKDIENTTTDEISNPETDEAVEENENKDVETMTSGFVSVEDENKNNEATASEVVANISTEVTTASTTENVKQTYNKPYNKNGKNNYKK